jgi:hypothetical protein
MATVCPITTRVAKYPGEVRLPAGQAGQTRDGVILCHQVRTIDLGRVRAYEIGGGLQFVTDQVTRASVRSALSRHFALDVPADTDGAAPSG